MPLALLEARQESPAVAAHIEPDDFGRVAQVFADQQRAIGGIMESLSRDLQSAGACIGKDHTAGYFDQTYQPAASTVTDGLCALFDAVGAVAQGLAKAGTDHSRADAISASNWRTTDYRTYQVQTQTSPLAPRVPGLRGYSPGWLPGVLEPVWPTKNDNLPSVAAAWRNAQARLRDVQLTLHGALTGLVGNNQGEDLQALEEFWGRFVHGDQAIFTALDRAMQALAQGVTEYGAMVDDFGDQLRQAIIQAALEAGAEAVVAILINVATDGLGLVLGGAEGEAIAARAVEHVGEVCANLLAALQVASTIQDIGVYGTTNLAAAMTKVPQPNLTTQEAWQAGDDIGQPGQLDPAERAIVGQLRENGHIIREVENRNIEKTPDILVDGEPTELKTVDAGGGKIAIFNKLKKAELKGGQAPNVLIDARATTISVDEAREEMESYLSKSRGVLQRVTIWLANGQKVTWPDGYEGL